MSTKPTNHSLTILSLIAGIVIIFVFCLYWGRINSNFVERKQQRIADNLLNEINELYIANEEITNQWQALEDQQQQLHASADLNRDKIDALWEEYNANFPGHDKK